jgi:hypothetical protein
MAIASNVPMAPYSGRQLLDYNYIANVAGPVAGANANTAAIDLVQPQWQFGQNAPVTYSPETGQSSTGGPDPVPERFWVNIAVTAQSTANTANSKNLNVQIQHTGGLQNTNTGAWSVDTGNYVQIPTLANPMLTVADNAGAGWAASSVVFRLPPQVKRYIRAVSGLEANGGNASNATVSLYLSF